MGGGTGVAGGQNENYGFHMNSIFRFPETSSPPSSVFYHGMSELLGETNPLGLITVYEPIETRNLLSDITLLHEKVHQMMLRLTSFGHLTTYLAGLVAKDHYRDELKMCLADQADVQEGVAYYVGLAKVMRVHPDRHSHELEKTPQSYRQIADALLAVLPQAGVRAKTVLFRAVLIEAIGRCSLDTDCLRVFAEPGSLNVQTLKQYLESNPSRARFATILNWLLSGGRIAQWEAECDRFVDADGDLDADKTMNLLLEKFLHKGPPGLYISGRLRTFGGLMTFAEKRGEESEILLGERKFPGPVLPSPAIAQSPDYLERIRSEADFEHRVNPEVLSLLFSLATAGRRDIYLWIYMKKPEEVYIDFFVCGTEKDGVTPSADAWSRFQRGQDALSGILETAMLVKILKSAPTDCIVATFYSFSYFLWDQATSGWRCPAFAMTGSAANDLSQNSLGLILEYCKMGKSASWFGISYNKKRAGIACFVSSSDPNIFGIQRLGGPLAYELFLQLIGGTIIPRHQGRPKMSRILEIASLPFVMPLLTQSDVAEGK
jgi:hypothetical protein